MDEEAWDDEEDTGPVLQFDYEAVANKLFKLASRQSTPSQNRKRLYKVIQKLRDLAGGIFPEDDVPEKAYKKLLEGRRKRKKKKKRLPTLQPQNKEGGARQKPQVQTQAGEGRGRGAGRWMRRLAKEGLLGRGGSPGLEPRGLGSSNQRGRRKDHHRVRSEVHSPGRLASLLA